MRHKRFIKLINLCSFHRATAFLRSILNRLLIFQGFIRYQIGKWIKPKLEHTRCSAKEEERNKASLSDDNDQAQQSTQEYRERNQQKRATSYHNSHAGRYWDTVGRARNWVYSSPLLFFCYCCHCTEMLHIYLII